MATLSDADKARLSALLEETLKKPPTIGVIGVSGVGKSSTINALFKTNLPVSHTVACTKEFQQIPLTLQMTQGVATGYQVPLVVCDAPGLGEDVQRDPHYLKMYREALPACEIILWVMTGRNRAIALDQMYLRELIEFQGRMVFGISQVDLVEPRDWKQGLPIPSKTQEQHIAEIVRDRRQRLSQTLGRDVEVIPYSSERGYQLEHLFTALLQSCTGQRSWIFHALKNFSLNDFVPANYKNSNRSAARDTAEPRISEHEIDDITKFLQTIRHGGIGAMFQRLMKTPTPKGAARIALADLLGRDDFEAHPLTEAELQRVEQFTTAHRQARL
jgi:predicted GTPase